VIVNTTSVSTLVAARSTVFSTCRSAALAEFTDTPAVLLLVSGS
jgi:hypothetical protein